jgi:glucose/mannose-6-phosphate isomerase
MPVTSMQLDDLAFFQALDSSHFLLAINELPDQIGIAWEYGAAFDLPWDSRHVQQVVIAGLGSAAIAAEIAVARIAGECQVPVVVWRDFDMPAFVGPETLVLALSPDGDDEETLSAALAAQQRRAKVAAITRGGELAGAAEANGWPMADHADLDDLRHHRGARRSHHRRRA